MGDERYGDEVLEGPMRVVPLGQRVDDGVIVGNYVLADGRTGVQRHWVFTDPEFGQLWDEARPTRDVVDLSWESRALLRWMGNRDIVALITPDTPVAELDLIWASAKPIAPVAYLDDGFRMSTDAGETFDVSEFEFRLLQESGVRFTAAKSIDEVVRRTLADPHDAEVAAAGTAETGKSFEQLMVDEWLTLAEGLRSVGAVSVERLQ